MNELKIKGYKSRKRYTFGLGLGVMLILVYSQQSHSSPYNVKASVMGVLAGFGILEFDYTWSPKIIYSAGVTRIYAKQESAEIQLFSFKLMAKYYFSNTETDSYYLSIYDGVSQIKASKTQEDTFVRSSLNASIGGIGGGYHWRWEKINLSLGYNLGLTYVQKVRIYDSEGGLVDEKPQAQPESGPELMVGYQF